MRGGRRTRLIQVVEDADVQLRVQSVQFHVTSQSTVSTVKSMTVSLGNSDLSVCAE